MARDRNAAERPKRLAVETIAEGAPDLRQREKRAARQHAVGEGRKRAALWMVGALGASAFGTKSVERHARQKAQEAERTWLAGERVEELAGAELKKLLGHGFYLFHDVPLAGCGNVDHVVLGEKGFYVIETKSHKGRVTAKGRDLLLNGRSPQKDFVKQAWRGCYRLREILDAEGRSCYLPRRSSRAGSWYGEFASCRSRGWSGRSSTLGSGTTPEG